MPAEADRLGTPHPHSSTPSRSVPIDSANRPRYTSPLPPHRLGHMVGIPLRIAHSIGFPGRACNGDAHPTTPATDDGHRKSEATDRNRAGVCLHVNARWANAAEHVVSVNRHQHQSNVKLITVTHCKHRGNTRRCSVAIHT